MGFYASMNGVDPVARGSGATTITPRRLCEGDVVGPARVAAPLRLWPNGGLCAGVLADGRRVVVKLVDDRAMGHDLFARERAALQRLEGGPVPDLVWFEESPTGGVLVLGAVAGERADLAATAAARDTERPRRVEVALAVLDAYTELHDRGVLHGQVHPGNVLVDRRGRVTIIDFGLADVSESGLLSAPRLSGGEQLDPVAAEALWETRPAPRLDAGAEQYALGTLLFRLLTGSAYLDLERDRDEALAAVITEPPRSFAELGADPWPEGERIVRRALAKAPWLRFASVAQLRACFASVAEPFVVQENPASDVRHPHMWTSVASGY